MNNSELIQILSQRILNVLKDSGETRIDEASHAIAKYLIESETVSEESLFSNYHTVEVEL